jgi:hypothetical protein
MKVAIAFSLFCLVFIACSNPNPQNKPVETAAFSGRPEFTLTSVGVASKGTTFFIGQGPTPEGASKSANKLCDEWITQNKAEEYDRSEALYADKDTWYCLLTLKFGKQSSNENIK